MKPVSKSNRTVMSVAGLSCLMLAAAISAFAVPPNQVARLLTNPTITATCCVPIGPTVQVIEPAAIAPVIVTWSVDYEVSAESAFNLSVNGGPCLFYGPGDAPLVNLKGGTGLSNSSYQWFVLPADGVLVKGKNTFTACAGGIGGPLSSHLFGRHLGHTPPLSQSDPALTKGSISERLHQLMLAFGVHSFKLAYFRFAWAAHPRLCMGKLHPRDSSPYDHQPNFGH